MWPRPRCSSRHGWRGGEQGACRSEHRGHQARDGAVNREIAAEAAVWIARLHGPDRCAQMEQEFLQWQARSAQHRHAFERCTETWQEVAGLTRHALSDTEPLRSVLQRGTPVHAGSAAQIPAHPPETRRRPWAPLSVASMASLVLGVLGVLVVGAYFLTAADAYQTGIGERRTVVLADGSHLSLNTSSRARVRMSASQRMVELDRGEAYFEVAKDSKRPFVVVASGISVKATGTAFVVRNGASMGPSPSPSALSNVVSVTLVEGRVLVAEGQGGSVTIGPRQDGSRVDPPSDPRSDPLAAPIVMVPGQRLRIGVGTPDRASSGRPVARRVDSDRPRIDQAVAWQRGEAVFDHTTVSDAVAEMNRYSKVPIVLRDAWAFAGLSVSGVFRTADSMNFANALATLHGARITLHPDRIELSPRQSP